jgi:protein-S-isoprenylcysteine O-methyltransferase Ste14
MSNKSKKNGNNNGKPVGSQDKQKTSALLEPKGFYDYVGDFKDYVSLHLLGGPKIFELRHIVNLQKGGTFFYLAFMMYYYQNFSLGTYLYLALHGSYGIMWVIKDYTFGDKNFAQKITIPSTLMASVFLGLYWLPAYWLLSRSPDSVQNPTPVRVFIAVIVYVFGCFLMFCSDIQKYYTLKYRKGLISEGMFKMNRNTNYLGEMLIYGSFGVASGSLWSWAIYLPVWMLFFNINMNVKDQSLRKKLGWEDYSRNSYLFLFKVFSSDLLNLIFYILLVVFFWYDYKFGGYIAFFLRK